jgi:hypothetical protein
MTDYRRLWERFASTRKQTSSRWADDAWKEFKEKHGFEPGSFAKRPPWCLAGARNNRWATKAFLGNPSRESVWAFAGYLDEPFSFAYLWLDYAGFSGLRSKALPYSVLHTRSEMRREARRLARAIDKLNRDLEKWPFRGIISLSHLVRDTDYRSSIRLPGGPPFTEEQWHLGAKIMMAGARQEIEVPMAGKVSLLRRASDVLQRWEPPESLIDRPKRKGARPRLAARWLDQMLAAQPGDFPVHEKHVLIAELVNVLGELAEWDDEPWSDEQVRRSLDGKRARSR